MTTRMRSAASCAECGGSSLLRDHEADELVCRACGYVVSSTLIDHGPEWRAFEPEQQENKPRVGAPVTWAIHDKGLSTTIGWQDRDASGRRLGPEARARLFRLRRWHQRSKVSDSAHRNLAHALGEVSKICGELSLPRSVMETSGVIYRRAIQGQLIRGRAIQSVAVACVYLACRQCGVVRTLDDVAEAAGLSRKEAGRNYRFLVRVLRPAVPQVDPQGYISMIVNRLSLGGETERLATLILDQASEIKITTSKRPQSMAAACVYISSLLTGEKRTQGEIAREAKVTEVTIRNRCKELAQRLEFNVYV